MIRAIRRALKPLLLWLNAWRFKLSDLRMLRLHRAGKRVAIHREYVRQFGIRVDRERISKW